MLRFPVNAVEALYAHEALHVSYLLAGVSAQLDGLSRWPAI